MKEKLFTSYKIRMASLILFTTQAIFSACEIYGQFAGAYVLLNSPMEGALQKHLHSLYLPKAEFSCCFPWKENVGKSQWWIWKLRRDQWRNKKKKKQLGNWYFDAFLKLKVSGFRQFFRIWQLRLHCYELCACLSKDWLVRHQTKKGKKTKPNKPFR